MGRPKGSRNRASVDAAPAAPSESQDSQVDEGADTSPPADVGTDAVSGEGLPAAVRLLRLYGYWTDDDQLRQWSEGHIETDPAEIADLIERGAPIEEVE